METLELDAPIKTIAAVVPAPMTRDFYWDEEGPGDNGWHPTTMPAFDAGGAFHVAHDTMEHLDQTDDSFEAEMKAFGSHLYLRGVTPYWGMKAKWVQELEEKEAREAGDPLAQLRALMISRDVDRRSAAEHMVGDLFSFLDKDHRVLRPAPEKKIVPVTAEAVLDEVERIGRKTMRDYDVGATQNSAHQHWDERIARAKDWIRIGYNGMEARLPGVEAQTRASAFLAIETAVNAVTLPTYGLDQGDPLRITVDFARRQVRAEVTNQPERDHTVPF